MLIFQPLLLKFPLWCLPLSEGPYHHSPFDIICSLYKQKGNPWESVENDRAGWCCYIRVARIATCPYLHLNLSLSHGQQSPFPAGWMSWGAACDRTASRPGTYSLPVWCHVGKCALTRNEIRRTRVYQGKQRQSWSYPRFRGALGSSVDLSLV